MKDPVVPLRIALYGHPLAGLYWEKFCTKHILACGFEKVHGWECMFVHRKLKLFLSVYVDDFKMAGKAENLSFMWKELGKRIELDPPTPIEGGTYLGIEQKATLLADEDLREKSELYHELFESHSMSKAVSYTHLTLPTNREV